MTKDSQALTYQSEVGRISKIILKHADQAFISDQVIESQWQKLNFVDRPEFSSAVAEYDRLVEIFRQEGIEMEFLAQDRSTDLDSIYVRDASVVCDNGAILGNMGKKSRRGEPVALSKAYLDAGIPILGSISGEGLLEGGDVVWLDEKIIVVGQGYRTNAEGIRQLEKLLGDCVDEIFIAQLPHWHGPSDVFHLMSVLSPIDNDKLLVYSPLMPAALRQMLMAREFELIEVPESEFETMACNVLALAPGKCLMLQGNPKTKVALEGAGVEVHVYEGNEISVKGAGGPTCLTRPTLRYRDQPVRKRHG
jgi:N-dimethylarginine dimethylaminohydrolase